MRPTSTATQDQIKETQVQVEGLTGIVDRTPLQEQQLQTLEGRLVSLRSTYATLLTYAFGNASNLLTVVEPAVAPISPVSPRPLLYTLLAAIVGLLLGAAIIFLMEYLDDRIKSADDLQEVVDIPTLGVVVRMRNAPGRKEIYRLVTLLYPRSPTAEAYRTLRTNTEFASVDAPIRTLLVTSSITGEGKTVTAANLAVAFAQAGRRVVLVDADLRKPGVHLLFDLPNAHGLTTLLRSDDVSLDAIAQPTEQANLRVLTTGPLPPNPGELLSSQRMREILDRLVAGGDLILFDGPPLQAVTDSAILSSLTDGTLLVVDAGHSRQRRGPTVARSACQGGRERARGRAQPSSGSDATGLCGLLRRLLRPIAVPGGPCPGNGEGTNRLGGPRCAVWPQHRDNPMQRWVRGSSRGRLAAPSLGGIDRLHVDEHPSRLESLHDARRTVAQELRVCDGEDEAIEAASALRNGAA